MSYWACARLVPRQEKLALFHLERIGFVTYLPRLREHRRLNGRKILATPALFPGYCFFVVEAQWHAARSSIGVIGLIMDGLRPARVADSVIDEIRSRERGGLVELPKREEFRMGEAVRVTHGPLSGQLGLYQQQRGSERVLVLLALLGGQQRVELPKDTIEVVS